MGCRQLVRPVFTRRSGLTRPIRIAGTSTVKPNQPLFMTTISKQFPCFPIPWTENRLKFRLAERQQGGLPRRVTAEWHAAADFRELVDQVLCRALTRSSAFGTVRAAGNSFRNWGPGDLDASARLCQIRAVLGAWAYTLLEAALVRDLSWAALGRHYRCDPKTARAWVIAAIKALRTV